MSEKYKYGIAMGGGGARGFVHLGVYKALQENGIQPEIIAGTSAGSIAGSCLASGLKPEEVFEMFKDLGIYKISRIHFPIDGLMAMDGLHKMLESLPFKNIEDLPIPFYATISNLNSGRVEYRNFGPLADIVTASSSIPIIFSPVEIDGIQYSDGGVFDNLPVKPIRDKCEYTIAVNILPVPAKKEVHNLLQVARRVFDLSVHGASALLGKDCDLLIEPEGLDKFDILTNKKADKLYEIGYQHTMKILENKSLGL